MKSRYHGPSCKSIAVACSVAVLLNSAGAQLGLAVLGLDSPLRLWAQSTVTVTLSPSASPSAGQPGVTVVNVTGAGFPSGTIPPANVTVTLQPSAGGSSATTPATAVTKIIGTTERVTFQIPSSITVSSPTPYKVSVAGSTSTGVQFASGNTASLTINPLPQIVSVTPNSGPAGQKVSVTITGLFTNFVQGATQASFGAGIAVGGAAEGAFGPVTVASATSATAQLVIDPAAVAESQTVAVQTGVQQESLPNGFTITAASTAPPTIKNFSPTSGPVATQVTITGTNFTTSSGAPPQVTLSKQGGGTIAAPVSSFSSTSITLVVPDGAATGPLTVVVAKQSATSTKPFTVTAPSSFALSVAPSTASVIQGESTAYAVTLTSTNGFDQLATLSVSGLPKSITSTFAPTQITAGQTSVLTVTAPAGQALGISTLSIFASATLAGQAVSQSANATLQVQAITTSFLGRTVVDDSRRTPIAGVTVKFLGVDASGNSTGCSGQTFSNAAGNFSFTGLPSSCTGPQLIGYDGSTATAPAGKFAGVNLSYTLTAKQVTTSPVLIHLPRIDNAATAQVQQNASVDQTFTFPRIPNVQVTVYAGTTFTLEDGSQPNPFKLIAIEVPVDRLPDVMPPSGMVMPFIVAFQPANATASQPVAVTFPNTLNTPPGVDMTLMTLDPTRGFMVPYGTGTVSGDGMRIIPDADPAHPGHAYGLVHFDWHGPMAPPAGGPGPGADGAGEGSGSGGGGGSGGSGGGGSPGCDCDCTAPPSSQSGDPVDLSSGIQIVKATDISISGPRGVIAVTRIYRTLSATPGPFGIGTSHNYGYELDDSQIVRRTGTALKLVTPDGNQFPFNQVAKDTFINTTVPAYADVVITSPSLGVFNMRRKDGTVYHFQTSSQGGMLAFLTSITDSNGNAITLTRNPADPFQLTQITDPVGRSLNLTYDSSDRITSIGDPIGRKVSYSYSGESLATVTDPAGGITTFAYDSQGRLSQMADPRGIVVFQNTYDANGRVIQQTEANGGAFSYSYTLLNPMVPTSPVLDTTVTDPMGNQSTYRFSPQGYLLDATDSSGQMRVLDRDPDTNNMVQGFSGAGSCAVSGKPQTGDSNFTFDANGNVLTWVDALGNKTSFTYDPTFNKLTSITNPLGNTSKFSYDSNGNLLTVTDPNGHATSFAYNSFGQVVQVVDAAGNTRNLAYDGAGNLAKIINPLGNSTSFTYDAISRLTSITDALGRTGTIAYDALGRLTSLVDANGDVTPFSYDPAGNLLTLTDARGNKTAFTYDGMNRVLNRTDAVGKSDSRTYDLNGNLIKFVDRRGQTSQFAYDSLNRLVSESYQDGSTVIRAYDANGRLVSVADSLSGGFDFVFDAAGHLTSSVGRFGTLQYSYDASGRLASRRVVGQPPEQYSYDAVGNLTGASTPPVSATFTYDVKNEVLTISRSNGISSAYNYDPLGRILSITHSSVSGALNSQNYTYDAVGDRASYVTDLAQPLTTQATNNTFDSADRLLTSSTKSYSYDANGNLMSFADPTGTTNLTWDTRNRLQSISQANGQKTGFLYDFQGNLIQQQDSGPVLNLTQDFVLDRNANPAYVSRSNGDNWSILGGRVIDQELALIHSSGTVEYGLTDILNSTVATTDGSGKVLASLFYEPFGQTSNNGSDYPFQYTGREPVAGTLYYYGARFYDSAVGRFISPDPLDFLGGTTNLYAYVSNRPVNYIDPRGLYGAGIVVGGEVDAGIIVAGAGAQVQGGYGGFSGGGGNSGFFGSFGTFAGGPFYGAGYPNSPDPTVKNVVGGAFAGAGVGPFISNAKCAADLGGPFNTFFLNLGIGLGVSINVGISDGTWIGSLSFGPSIGSSGGQYPTNTWATH
jgi:RHS repeat-associated protein